MSNGRRGHREGSVFQRKDGLWVALLDLGRIDGKRKRKALYGKTRREVQEKLTAALHTQQRGLPLTSDAGQTVEAFLRTWLDGSKARVRANTWARYEILVRKDILPNLGQLRLSRLSAAHVQQMQGALLNNGKSPTTVRKVHALLHHALDDATKWGLVARNEVALVDAPRPQQSEMTPLDELQVRRLIDAAGSYRLEALYVLAVAHGMRQGEILGLRWRDVDLDRGALQVRHTISWVGGAWAFSEPKTKRSRRQIKLARVVVDAIRLHRKRQLEERLRLGAAWQEMDLVFPNELGRPIEPTNLLRSLRAVLRNASLPRIRFHDLRHTAATIALGRGVHPKIVSEMLGHSSVAITLDLYSHVVPSLQGQAADAIDAMLSARPESLATDGQQ